jgi:GntR family transcriptional repressor for pyruvate dehydrogenase complex
VRQALFTLQQQGLVEITSGTRARVTAPSGKFLSAQIAGLIRRMTSTGQGHEHMEQARLLFEAGVAWQAARVATDEDIQRLKAALDANAAAIGNTGLFVRTDVAFHAELTVICRNPVFTGVHDAIVGWLIDQRTTTIHMPDADRLSIRDHTAIYEAVAARDPMRAFHEMTSHLRLISELYSESKRLSEDILRQIARDVAGRIERERESMWVAPKSGNGHSESGETARGRSARKAKEM